MATEIRLSELGDMSDEALRARIAEMRNEPANGELDRVNEEIANLEREYKMTSVEMVVRLKERKIRETTSVCHWLMLLDTRERLSQ